MKNPEYFMHAINALAEVKSNLIGNKFDVTKLEVSDCDSENLSISVGLKIKVQKGANCCRSRKNRCKL